MPNLLEVRGLNIGFPGQGSPAGEPAGKAAATPSLPAVRDLSFSIAAGEVLGLVGESGSGKSITSLAIMRLLPPQARVSGEIFFARNGSNAHNLTSIDDDSMRQLRGSRLAMIFQEPMTALNPVMRVGDQIAEAVMHHDGVSRRAARARALELFERVRIPAPAQRLDNFPHELSGGMRQRVMIAVALASRPKLLLADEPTTALDATVQIQILLLLRELQHELGLAVIFVTHTSAWRSRSLIALLSCMRAELSRLEIAAAWCESRPTLTRRGCSQLVPSARSRRMNGLQPSRARPLTSRICRPMCARQRISASARNASPRTGPRSRPAPRSGRPRR